MAGEAMEIRCPLSNTRRSKITASGAKTKGDVEVIEDRVVAWADDIASGSEGTTYVGAEKAVFPKTTGETFAVHNEVRWNDSTKKLTKNSAFRPVGTAIRAAASNATTAWIEFHQEATGGSTY